MLKDDILVLAKLSRSRKNLERIREQTGELSDLHDDAKQVLTEMAETRERLQELADALGGVPGDNPFTSWSQDLLEALSVFQAAFPAEDTENIGELIGEAVSYADDYESCLDDSEYSAVDREEVWGNLLDALENIAGALP
jgi:hypothetical protein